MKTSLSQRSQKQITVEHKGDFWATFKSYFCPCLIKKVTGLAENSYLKNELIQNCSIQSKVDSVITQKQLRGEVAKLESLKSNTKMRKRSEELRQSREEDPQSAYQTEAVQTSYRGTMQLSIKNRWRLQDEMDWSIWNIPENQLTAVGSDLHSLLVKVTSVQIKPNFGKLKQLIARSSTKFSFNPNQRRKDNLYKNYQFDRFWEDRYLFFDKFDEGIKIDEESWQTLPPESICEYIASKLAGRSTILDAFAGVGPVTIKLAALDSCSKVTANQSDKEKLSFLLNNATIYELDTYLDFTNCQFLKLEKKNFDAVFIQPPLANLQARSNKGISINDFSPSLDEIICKAMKIAGNMVLLLPPDTNIEQICSCISKWGSRLKWMKDFCSAVIEKIVWRSQLKYILLCVGKQVQTHIKLNDELEFIYMRLRNWNDRYFKEKKIIKKIREDHGMIDLFNAVKQSLARKRKYYLHNHIEGPASIQFFYQVILERNFISEERLNKIKVQQEQVYDKKGSLLNSLGINEEKSLRVSPFSQQEKVQDNPMILRQAELTSSEYSYISYFQTLSKGSRSKQGQLRRGNTNQSKGVIIKRSEKSQHNQYSMENGHPFQDKGERSNPSKQRVTELIQKADGNKKKFTKET